MKILICNKLSEEGIEILRKCKKFSLEIISNLSSEKLKRIISNYEAIILEDSPKIDKEIIRASKNLRLIAKVGIDLENIDIEEATKKGILVISIPKATTTSAAEYTFALILALSRNIVPANISLRNLIWEKERFKGVELDQKTLGIIGLGRIGREVAKKASAFNMKVVAYDPNISKSYAQRYMVNLIDLKKLLQISDFITLHLPLNSETRHILSYREFKLMKKGVKIINCACGGLIDEDALLKAIENKTVSGVALDVFEKEPPFESPLIKLDNCLTLPHLGAFTEEAFKKTSIDIANQVKEALLSHNFKNAVNIPQIEIRDYQNIKDFLPLGEKLGSMQAQISKGDIEIIHIMYQGNVASFNHTPLTSAILKGILKEIVPDTVINYVNAPLITSERGIKVVESKNPESKTFSNLISLNLKTSKEEHKISATLLRKREAWIVFIDGYRVDALPKGYMLLIKNRDIPGVIGKVGTILGNNNINIGNLKLGRNIIGGIALSVWNIDSSAPKRVLNEIKNLREIIEIKQIKL